MLEFRRATREDANQVVPLIHESSRELIDYSFEFKNETAANFLAHDFLKGQGVFGYLNQFVAVGVSGEIVGTLTVYPGRHFRTLTLHTMLSAWRHCGPMRFLVVAR